MPLACCPVAHLSRGPSGLSCVRPTPLTRCLMIRLLHAAAWHTLQVHIHPAASHVQPAAQRAPHVLPHCREIGVAQQQQCCMPCFNAET
mmetsp:Transcript_27521/g.74459  ORF Transcript_27521/g.74459 Transcript_27521/m.74459 type:complete len:89 (-) Transcript_27521:808-1074(-)